MKKPDEDKSKKTGKKPKKSKPVKDKPGKQATSAESKPISNEASPDLSYLSEIKEGKPDDSLLSVPTESSGDINEIVFRGGPLIAPDKGLVQNVDETSLTMDDEEKPTPQIQEKYEEIAKDVFSHEDEPILKDSDQTSPSEPSTVLTSKIEQGAAKDIPSNEAESIFEGSSEKPLTQPSLEDTSKPDEGQQPVSNISILYNKLPRCIWTDKMHRLCR